MKIEERIRIEARARAVKAMATAQKATSKPAAPVRIPRTRGFLSLLDAKLVLGLWSRAGV